MQKPAFCICKNKGQVSWEVATQLIRPLLSHMQNAGFLGATHMLLTLTFNREI